MMVRQAHHKGIPERIWICSRFDSCWLLGEHNIAPTECGWYENGKCNSDGLPCDAKAYKLVPEEANAESKA